MVGFSSYLLLSGAPPRVHLATAGTWIPAMVLLASLHWTLRLKTIWKVVVMSVAVVGAGAMMAYATSVVVVKVSFDAQLWLAHALLLFIAFPIVMLLTSLGESALRNLFG